MSMTGYLRSGTLAILALAVLAAVAPARAEWRIEREFPLRQGGEFFLDTDHGSVNVKGTSTSVVRVIVTSRRDDIESLYNFSFVGDEKRVEVQVGKKGSKLFSWFSWSRGSGLHFDIEVPERTLVDIDTAGGAINAESIQGSSRLDTAGGAIKARNLGGDVRADTSGGSITIENVDGDATADTSGGNIVAENVRGKLHADTSGGSILARDVSGDVFADTSGGSIEVTEAGGRVSAETSGGSITVSFVAGNSSGGELETSGGGIKVRLDPSADLDIDAVSSGGRVASQIPITVQGRQSRTALRGTLGAGGERLELRASGGPIRIDPL